MLLFAPCDHERERIGEKQAKEGRDERVDQCLDEEPAVDEIGKEFRFDTWPSGV